MSTGEAAQAATQGGGEQAAEGQGQGADLAQFTQTLQSLQGGQEELRQFLAQQPWQQQEAAPGQQEEAPAPLDWSFLDPGEPDFDPREMATRLGGLIDQTMTQREQAFLQQHVNPLNERLEGERVTREAQMLVDEFPEMGDPEIGPQVVAAARQTAEAHGQPQLANEPWFWRQIFMAGKAAQAAQEEGAETPDAAHLEGGAGARPGAQQVDMGEQMFSGSERPGRRALPFG